MSRARARREAVRGHEPARPARRSEVRAAEPRKATKLWSAQRPAKPAADTLYEQIRRALREDKRSTWEKANASGLSTSTIRNWDLGKVRYPQSVSLQMAARILGKQIVLK